VSEKYIESDLSSDKYPNVIEENHEDVKEIFEQVKSLINFVNSLEMGAFYSKELEKLIKQDNHAYAISLNGGHDYRYEQAKRDNNLAVRKKLIANRDKAIYLIIELLRYQKW